MPNVFTGILHPSIRFLNSAIILASLRRSRLRKRMYLSRLRHEILQPRSKTSFLVSSSRMRQALRRVTTMERRKEETMPAKLPLQLLMKRLMLRLRKRRDSQQDLKQRSNSRSRVSTTPCILDSPSRTSSLVLSVPLFTPLMANMEDSTFSMMLAISPSSPSPRLADCRMNCSPASFFMLELTFTCDISCMISSSSGSSSSTSGQLPTSSPCAFRMSWAMRAAASGRSTLRMKMSRRVFLGIWGRRVERRSARTDLLWNWAQNLLVIWTRLQRGRQTSWAWAVRQMSAGSNLYSPMLRQRRRKEGRRARGSAAARGLVSFSRMMQMLLVDWMISTYCGCTPCTFSCSMLLQDRKLEFSRYRFSITTSDTSVPLALRPSASWHSTPATRSPTVQSLMILPFPPCIQSYNTYSAKLNMQGRPYDEMVKFMLIGDSSVGKSSIMRQFTERKFKEREVNTVGLDYGERVIGINGKNVLIQIWDTAGQERFRTLTPSYYRSAMGILLVYSVADKASFNSVEIWMRQIRQYAVENIPILILSNKADVEFKEVSEQQSRALAERHNVDLLVTSAKKNINIERAMIQLYHKIEKEKKVIASNSKTHTISLKVNDPHSKCTC